LGAIRALADRLIGLFATIGIIGIFAQVAVIVTDVIGRAFGAPLYGSQDMVTMVLVIVVFGGMALCDRKGGHIGVDLLEHWFPDWLNRAIDIAAALLGALIFTMIAIAVWESAKLSQMLNLSTNLMRWPKAWFQWALCGFALMAAAGMILRAVELTFLRRDVRREAGV
jgi:TRAP-type C4-dicarboxylate transport system permease small subunit